MNDETPVSSGPGGVAAKLTKDDTLFERWVNAWKNHPVVAPFLILTVGVGGGAQLIESTQKLFAILRSTLGDDQQTRTLRGRVHEFGDSEKGIPTAKISLDARPRASTDVDGNFQFVVPGAEVDTTELLSVRAAGFAPFEFPRYSLRRPFETLLVPLTPLREAPTELMNPKAQVSLPVVGGAALPSDPSITRFYFDYTFDPPGRRSWHLLESRLWIELYETNRFSFFVVQGTATVDGCVGRILVKSPVVDFHPEHGAIDFTPDPVSATELFLPHRGCRLMWLRFRHRQEDDWSWLSEMQGIG